MNSVTESADTSGGDAQIVIGHDGSSSAGSALTMALRLADRLERPLLVVRAWSIATAARLPSWEFGYVPSFDELAAATHDQLVSDAAAEVGKFPSVTVEWRAVHANPAKCLVELSHGAEMLVVGCRGLGGFAGLVLGSVSEQCVRHAACPVLVVRREP